MPTESELREWMLAAGPEAPARGIDPAIVIRRSRRRRVPRQLAAGGTVGLAIAGIGAAGFAGVSAIVPMSAGGTATSTYEESAPESAGGSESGVESGGDAGPAEGSIGLAPADRLNLCGGPVAEVAPSPTGLVLTTVFPATAPTGTGPVTGTVTLSNTGTERVIGTTAATPAITLAQDGTVLWHSNGPMIMMAAEVDLAPGESMSYPAAFTPVLCEVEDDLAESFRDDLPPAPAGVYQVSAAIDLLLDPASPGADILPPNGLVTGPAAPVTLG